MCKSRTVRLVGYAVNLGLPQRECAGDAMSRPRREWGVGESSILLLVNYSADATLRESPEVRSACLSRRSHRRHRQRSRRAKVKTSVHRRAPSIQQAAKTFTSPRRSLGSGWAGASTNCRSAEWIDRICHRSARPEPPRRMFRLWGRHGGPIIVLRAAQSARGCVP